MLQRPTVIEHASTHWSDRAGSPIRAIVLHHTAGTDSLDYLTQNADKVSTHALISKAGVLYRMVPDRLAANTVGFSNLGPLLAHQENNPNRATYNIELENTGSGRDPYPDAQVNACAWDIARVWKQYGVLPILPHALIDTHGKTDPLGLDLARVYRAALAWYDGAADAPIVAPYTEDSPILGPARATLDQAVAWFRGKDTGEYTPYDVRVIVAGYFGVCAAVGVDPVLAVAQMIHESAHLSSYWSQRPRRNPAGLGVVGTPGVGLSFASWLPDAEHPEQVSSIEAHVGRLVAYAVLPVNQTPAQAELVRRALSVRSLPTRYWGCSPTLAGLRNTWAVPGTQYPQKVADIANAIRSI
ncbi:MAG TPA: peptidoglycan recognition family protein [Roseiflexaceae bacterium]|nr:peptidoglycan recognition family protein [Roseiflexaceae bacterium]